MNTLRQPPTISVATSVYNGERYLAEAIESVLAQDFGDFEFLLLDDGSQDQSRAIAERYAARDPRIRVIARENRGLVASLNQLFEEAQAPLVARFDADDICAPDRFTRQLAFMAGHPDHGVVGSAITYIDASGAPPANPPVAHPGDHAALAANLEHGPVLCHSAIMVRRDLVLAAGGYRPAYVHAEDYDLWLRLSGVTKMANLPQRLLSYRVTDDQVSAKHMIAQARNAAIAWRAHLLRQQGLPDPTDGLAVLPTLDQLDAVLGSASAAYVRRRVVDRALFAPEALAGEGWDALLGHIADTGAQPRLWRVAGRLLKAGKPLHAARAAAALAGLAV
jgi:glycosyltransferase involved in cell wall biosynthesis